MSFAKQGDDESRARRSSVLASLASLVLAVLISGKIAALIVSVLSLTDASQMVLSLGLVTAIALADPIGAVFSGRDRWRVAVKFGVGLAFGTGLAHLFLAPNGAAPFWAAPAFIIVALLISAFFARHAANRFFELKGRPLGARITSAILEYADTSGPLVMLTALALAGALFWLLAPGIALLVTVMGLIFTAMVVQSLVASDEVCQGIERTHRRSSSLPAAFRRIVSVLSDVLPGALFFVGLLYLAGTAIMPVLPELAFISFDPLGAVGDGVVALIIGLVLVPGVMVAASVAGATTIVMAGEHHGWSVNEIDLRIEVFGGMILGGALTRVLHSSLETSGTSQRQHSVAKKGDAGKRDA